jgi:uncharacterized membrane protein YqaE (UPF0057 family)
MVVFLPPLKKWLKIGKAKNQLILTILSKFDKNVHYFF